MNKKNFARIGIDENSHQLRAKRVKFIVRSMECFDNDSGLNPLHYGYIINEHLCCVPERYSEPALPNHFLESLHKTEQIIQKPKCGDNLNDDNDDGDDDDDNDDDDDEDENNVEDDTRFDALDI